MCGRPPFGKDYFGVLTCWSVAGTCPAFDCGLSKTAAGHDEVRRSGSKQARALFALVAKRIIPIRVSTLVITPSAPHQFVWPQKPDALCQLIAVLKLVSFVIKAQTIRAILLASATAATLAGFRSSNSVAHCVEAAFDLRLKRNTAVAPITRKRRM
jgi:hypothetical protein